MSERILRAFQAQSPDAVRALARAAHSLHESLDLGTVLRRIGREATEILAADVAAVWRGNPLDGIRVEAVHGFPPETIGYELAPGAGLAGRVIQSGKAMIASDYQRMVGGSLHAANPFRDIESVLAVPMEWEGERRGVLAVGYLTPTKITSEALELLEAFAELSAVACSNASAHAGLAHQARTDALTGCLNHAALQEALRREVERCARAGGGLSLALLDLDDFKEINEGSGHLVGDEVLRRVGHSLRNSVRPYDLVARYGGDEFAIVCVDAGEGEAGEIAARAIAQLGSTVEDLAGSDSSIATAGVAEWQPGLSPTHLIGEADRALLYGKQEGRGGAVIGASTLPPGFRPGRFRRDLERAAEAAPLAAAWPGASEAQTRRLHKRTRQLALANALGTRLSAMTDADEVVTAAIDQLHQAFGYFLCAALQMRDDGELWSVAVRGEAAREMAPRGWTQPAGAGIIGRCVRERRTVIVNDVSQDSDYQVHWDELPEIGSELAVPLWVGERLWGAIDVEESEKGAFDEDDARLVQTVADMVGSALRSALLYEQLDRAYMGTAEALAAALEAKDAYTASHSHSIAEHAVAVGAHLGLDAEALRTVRYAAVFHDIGKIAVPEAILHKRGPLTPEEWAEIERHPVAGAQILAPVEFLAGVRVMVRHEHERWDGTGYPDRLKGEEIPLGSRIVLACDAYDAMTTDRPYRPAMTVEAARAELVRGAGSQFDPRVVDALIAVLDQAAVNVSR